VRNRTLLPAISKAINSAPFDEANAFSQVTDLLYTILEKPGAAPAPQSPVYAKSFAAAAPATRQERAARAWPQTPVRVALPASAVDPSTATGGIYDDDDVEDEEVEEEEIEVKVDAPSSDEDVLVSSLVPRGSRLAVRSAGPFVPAQPVAAPAALAAPASGPLPPGFKPKPPSVYTTSTGKIYSNCTDAAFLARPRFGFLPPEWFLMTAPRGACRHADVYFVEPDRKTHYWYKNDAMVAVQAWRAARGE
jgi:hypothetical protein